MKKFFLLLLLFSFNYIANSQVQKPTKWKFFTQKITETEYFLVFEASIDDGWHLYSPFNPEGGSLPLKIEYNKSSEFQLIGKIIEIPKPTIKYDEIFKKDEYFFEEKATFKQKIKILVQKDVEIIGTIEGQNCLEDGRCINFSEDLIFKIPKPQNIENQENNKDTKKQIDTIAQQKDSIIISETDTNTNPTDTSKIVKKISLEPTGTTPILVVKNAYENTEHSKSLFWFFIISFLLGLAALLTPCVFPMVPMTISFFIKDKNTARGRINALVYGINIVAIYTLPIALIILIAQLFGAGQSISGDFANFLSTHWIPNILFFIIFMIFAASFLGAFEITLPYWLVNPVSQKSGKGGFWGVFFMAFTLVLVSFSCTGPIVGAVLVESTQGGLIVKPMVGMLGFSIGVALPFTLFAYFPNWLQKLPKSGGWLNSVKVVLGFIELALGLKFLSVADQTYHWGILNREIYLALWIVIFLLMGLYLLGKIKFAHDDEVKHLGIFRLFLVIVSFSFVLYMLPGMWGAPLKELSGYLPPKQSQAFDLERLATGKINGNICEKPLYADQLHLPHGLVGYFDVYQALNCSKQIKKPIFVDFTGHGCVNCRKMEENVWSDPRVLKILSEDYIILSLYVDDKVIGVQENRWFTSIADGKQKKELGKQNADIQIVNFGKNSQPLYALIDHKGNVLAPTREYDTDIDNFVKFLEEGKNQYKLLHPAN